MKMQSFILSNVLALLLTSGSLVSQSCQMAVQTTTSGDQGLIVEGLLMKLAESNDKFFTVEEGMIQGAMGHLRGYCIAPPPPAETFSDDLHYLSQAVPDFTYEVDSINSNIVHIIDGRLARHESYALDEITSLTFDGSVERLVGALHANGIPVSAGGAFDSHEFMFIDRGSQVRVRANGLAVRSILSDFLPLKGRGRMLWRAETELGSDKTCYVRFRGAPRS